MPISLPVPERHDDARARHDRRSRRPSATAYVNVGTAAAGARPPTQHVSRAARSYSRHRRAVPNARARAQSGSVIVAAGDRRADERIVRQQRRAVEIRVVEQRRELRRGRDAEARLDHAARHHEHVVRARGRDHAQRFTQSAALRELDVDAVHRAGEPRDVGRDEADSSAMIGSGERSRTKRSPSMSCGGSGCSTNSTP